MFSTSRRSAGDRPAGVDSDDPYATGESVTKPHAGHRRTFANGRATIGSRGHER